MAATAAASMSICLEQFQSRAASACACLQGEWASGCITYKTVDREQLANMIGDNALARVIDKIDKEFKDADARRHEERSKYKEELRKLEAALQQSRKEKCAVDARCQRSSEQLHELEATVQRLELKAQEANDKLDKQTAERMDKVLWPTEQKTAAKQQQFVNEGKQENGLSRSPVSESRQPAAAYKAQRARDDAQQLREELQDALQCLQQERDDAQQARKDAHEANEKAQQAIKRELKARAIALGARKVAHESEAKLCALEAVHHEEHRQLQRYKRLRADMEAVLVKDDA